MLRTDCGGSRHKPSPSRRRRRDALRRGSRRLVPVGGWGRRAGLARTRGRNTCGVRGPAPEPWRLRRLAGHDPVRRCARKQGSFPMMIDVLLNALVPIFAVMALGYFAGWIRDVDNHHVAELNALVMDFALPASLFAATASTSGAVLSEQWPLLVVFTVSMLVLYALSYWMQRHLFGLESSEAAVQAITVALPNYAAAGLPLIATVFGSAGTIYVALSIATGSIVLSPLTLATLEINKVSAGGKNSGGPLQAIGRS